MFMRETETIQKQEGKGSPKNQPFSSGINKNFVLKGCVIVGLLFPFLVVLFLYLRNTADVPYYDGWNFFFWYKRAEQSGVTPQFIRDILSYKYISHRIPVTHVLHMLLWKLTNCNDIITVMASYVCLIFAFLLFLAYGHREKIPLVFFLPISALIFSLKQGAMLFWAAYLMLPLCIVCALVSFYNYSKAFCGGGGNLVFSLLFAVLTTFCRAEGLNIWLVYIMLFLLEKLFEGKRFFTKINITFLLSGAICFYLYFSNWAWDVHDKIVSPASMIKALIMLLASPFVGSEEVTGDMQWNAFLLGSCIFAGSVFILCRICEKKMISRLAFPILTAGFFFGGIAMMAFGRSEGGSLVGRYLKGGLLGTQYCSLPIWFAAAMYLLFIEYLWVLKPDHFKPIHKYVPTILFVLFSLISIGYYELETKPFMEIMEAAAYTLQHFDEVPESMRRLNVYPGPFDDAFYETVPWIQENHYFLFGSDKKYTYPFDDYIIAERQSDFTFPEKQIAEGNYYIDSINGEALDGADLVISPETGLNFTLWATDSLHSAAPAAVLIEVGGEYHELKPYERPDVVQVYAVDAYVDSGFRGYVSTRLKPGVYPINLIVLCENGESFYSATIASVEIS